MPQLPTNNPVRNHWHIPCGVSLPVIQSKQEIWTLMGSVCLPLHVPLPCTCARPPEAHLALPLIHKSGSQDSKRSHFHPGSQTSSGLHFPTPLGLAFWMFELTCFHHISLPSFLLPSSLPPILPPSLFLLSSIPHSHIWWHVTHPLCVRHCVGHWPHVGGGELLPALQEFTVKGQFHL